MSITYKVKTRAGLNIRKGPGTNYAKIRAYSNGTTLVSGDGKVQNGWAHITTPNNGWCCMTYLVKVASSPAPKSTTAVPTKPVVDAHENNDVVTAAGRTIVGKTDKDYSRLYWRYIRAFGCPPQYNQNIDIQYINNICPGVGRVFAKSMLSNPSILSICPGTVDYLPGFSKQEKSQFLERVAGLATDNNPLRQKILGEKDQAFTSGKLFEFKQAYRDYITIVNVLCRTCAIFLGIGDKKMPYTQMPYKNFDYGWYTTPEQTYGVGQDPSIFGETFYNLKKSLGSAVGDDTYVHFFITHQGTSINTDVATGTESSELENIVNGGGIDSMARNLNFLFGGPIGNIPNQENMTKDINAAFNTSPLLKSFGFLASNYLKGGRLVFPQMVTDVNWSNTMSASMKFVSPYGDTESIFLRCIVPTMHLLAFSLPKQIADNMYTYPFIVRAFQKGWYNSDLAIISNLRITRGGQDDTSWTVNQLSTEIDVSFDVTPLYSQMMVTSSKNPFLYMKNSALIEYLATTCGVDIKANNLQAKIEVAKSMIKNKFDDIPTNIAAGIGENLASKVQHLFQIQSR